jgi:hypothetical protein
MLACRSSSETPNPVLSLASDKASNLSLSTSALNERDIVAWRPVAWERPRSKQLYNSRCSVTAPQTGMSLRQQENTAIMEAMFSTRSVPRCYKQGPGLTEDLYIVQKESFSITCYPCDKYTWQRRSLFIRDRPISSERTLHKDYDRKGWVEKK